MCGPCLHGQGQEEVKLQHVAHLQAVGILAGDKSGSSDPYCRLELAKERAKTRTLSATLSPEWRESVHLCWSRREESLLLVELWDWNVAGKDDFLGSVQLQLDLLAPEVTHELWRPLEGGQGHLNLLVTVTGTGGLRETGRQELEGKYVGWTVSTL